jgi:hypothetical protein
MTKFLRAVGRNDADEENRMGQKVHPYGFRLGYTKPWKWSRFAGVSPLRPS